MSPPRGDALRVALRASHGLDLGDLVPERDGADATAWAWRATDAAGARWFVKARRDLREAAIRVPIHLAASGFPEVVAARPAATGDPWLEIDGWTVVVMPLVDGPTAFRAGLALDGWRDLGAFARRLHAIDVAVDLPADLVALLPVERFRPKATDAAREVDARIDKLDRAGLDELSVAVRSRWLAERATIRRIVDLTDAVSDRIRARPAPPPRVLCHADFHAANVLVEPSGGIRIVDWDEVILAPRERDLMFVRGSVVAGRVTDAEADAFEAAYEAHDIDGELVAWYRLDWTVQDLEGFAREVLFEPDRDPPTRPRAARIFEALFDADDEVGMALAIAREGL
jgi:spectinomycin phosphotransferase